jgi:signal transduction histidine kinase
MKANSLAFRLFSTATAWTLLVLPMAGFITYSLYRQEIEASFDRRVGVLLTVILSDSVDHGGNEPGSPKDIGEPLFEIPQSGWYWQIKPMDKTPGRRLGSASLGNEPLALPSDQGVPPNDREVRWSEVYGPSGERLRIAETVYLYGEGKESRPFSIAVAGTLSEPESSLSRFRTRLTAALALAGLGLIAVTLFQVRFGLLPLRKVEKGLAAVRSGDAMQLEGDLPAEIEPLQIELNALLKSNQDIIERARTQVGNLAHGLKTPLAVIINEAREDKSPLAEKVVEQASLMRDQINHYLDRARMAANAGVIGRVTEVKGVADSISRALERIYRDKDLDFTIECQPEARFMGERQDLEEMLGNLLDNASKWATGAVTMTANVAPADDPRTGTGKTSSMWLTILIEDDGPGLSDAQLAEPVKRGRRLDETKPGSGLGHSIVADLAHSYRGTFELARSAMGGLQAKLVLPAAV